MSVYPDDEIAKVSADLWRAQLQATVLLAHLKDVTRILRAVRHSAGLGKTQTERLAAAEAAIASATGQEGG